MPKKIQESMSMKRTEVKDKYKKIHNELLEMTHIMSEMKRTQGRINSRLDMAADNTSEHEGIEIENI